MKTKIYFSALLAIIVHVMVKSQTPVSLALNFNSQFTLGGNSQKLILTNENALLELVKQSDDLSLSLQKLRSGIRTFEALRSSGLEKNKLIEAANLVYKQYETKQIEISELTAKISYERYELNKMTIKALKNGIKDLDVLDHAESLMYDSERALKMAIEMREEAYAEPSNSAKLGVMGNAEEKEYTALHKQSETINLLESGKQNIIVHAFAAK